MSDELFDKGMAVRKAVLGEEYVARAEANKTDFDADWQRYVTEHAWAAVWTRPGLEKRTRSMLTIAMLASLGTARRIGRAYPGDAQHRRDQGRSQRSTAASRRLCRRAGGELGVCHRQAGLQRNGNGREIRRFTTKAAKTTKFGEIIIRNLRVLRDLRGEIICDRGRLL